MFPDISEFQGVVNWDSLGLAFSVGEIEAVSMRAGFGTVRADLQFARNQRECRARGIPAIFYWFNYPTFNSPQAEAAMFNSVVGPLRPREAMMGDFEDDPTSNSVFPRGQAGIDWASAFLTALQAPPNATWFYTYTSLFQEVDMAPLLATWPFVWADYSIRTDNPFGAIARQFTDCGATPGVVGCCDQNVVLKPPLSRWLTPAAPGPPPPPKLETETMVIRNPADGAVYVVDSSGKRHIAGAEYGAWKQTPGFAEVVVDAATVAEIPDVASPPAANLQPVLDAVAALKADLDALTLKKA